MAQPSLNGHDNNLVQTIHRIEGAYSLAIMTEQELIGCVIRMDFVRSPSVNWAMPVLASETCAFDLIHAQFVRDVEPPSTTWQPAPGRERDHRVQIELCPCGKCSARHDMRSRTSRSASMSAGDVRGDR